MKSFGLGIFQEQLPGIAHQLLFVFKARRRAHSRAYVTLAATPKAGDRASKTGELFLDASSGLGWLSRFQGCAQQPRGHIDMWEPYVAGYENPIYTAAAYAYACQLTDDEELLQAARRWADSIRAVFPPRQCDLKAWYGPYAKDWAPHGTYAGLYGRTISFFLELNEITGEAEYLGFARQVARESLSKLYYQGLIRGHACKPYYESIDGVGYLLLALLELDAAEGK